MTPAAWNDHGKYIDVLRTRRLSTLLFGIEARGENSPRIPGERTLQEWIC